MWKEVFNPDYCCFCVAWSAPLTAGSTSTNEKIWKLGLWLTTKLWLDPNLFISHTNFSFSLNHHLWRQSKSKQSERENLQAMLFTVTNRFNFAWNNPTFSPWCLGCPSTQLNGYLNHFSMYFGKKDLLTQSPLKHPDWLIDSSTKTLKIATTCSFMSHLNVSCNKIDTPRILALW